jgi:hypothetical protein
MKPITRMLVSVLSATALLASTLLASTPVAAAGPAAPLSSCDPGGLRPLLASGNILLVGEIHGAVEGPALIGAAACAAVAEGLPLTVALEIPREEDERLERFLASPGAASDREALLAGSFWQRDYQDGRSSIAMLQLLDRLRGLRGRGAKLRTVLLDSAPLSTNAQARDDFMGQRLVEAVSSGPPGDLLIALAGNYHTRTTMGLPFDAAYRPAGLAAEQRWPERTVSLLLKAPAGTTWMCTTANAAECGVKDLSGKPIEAPGTVELYTATREGYEGEVRLGSATASPPAAR